jgi:hypothetical protein
MNKTKHCKFFDSCPVAAGYCKSKQPDGECIDTLIRYSVALRENTDKLLMKFIELKKEKHDAAGEEGSK